jgi:high frequency lysogenization protein
LTSIERDRILALAGVFQSAQLVQDLARRAQCDQDAFRASLRSTLIFDTPDIASLFGGTSGLRLGLTRMRELLKGYTVAHDVEITRYVVSMVQLALKLQGQQEVVQELREGIAAARTRYSEDLESAVEPPAALVHDLAQLYARTVSNMNPRILVYGEHGYLTDLTTAARVRAALLAGVRSAVAWVQLGGRRWHLLVSRRRLLREAENAMRG